MAITAKVNTTRSVVGSVSQGNQPQVTRVTVPGPKGDTGLAGSAQNQISSASDVDVTSFPVQDGSLLQYRSSTGKWTARNELDTTSGNLVLSGGSF
jgi:GTPase Era involved in 16S rRNA processing